MVCGLCRSYELTVFEDLSTQTVKVRTKTFVIRYINPSNYFTFTVLQASFEISDTIFLAYLLVFN